MKTLFIVGGDGFARECCQRILDISSVDSTVKFGGFLGHNGYRVDFKVLDRYFICDVVNFEFKEDHYAVIGAGYPGLRVKIYQDLKKRNINLHNLIPPGVRLSPQVTIGEGNVFAPSCVPSPDVRIGNGNVFNGDVIVGHDAHIGDFNFIGGRSQILGNCRIGDLNTVGAGSILLPRSRIGNHNKISPLSAVYKGCKDNCILHGNPALNVGRNDTDEGG